MSAPVLHASASPSEWAAGLLSDAKVEALTQHFKAAGFCCVGDVIPASALDAARERLDFDAAHQALGMKHKERGPASGAGGHLQLGVPRCGPFVTAAIASNPIIEQLAVALLGCPEGGVFMSFFNGNTNIPGSGTQLLHADGGWYCQSEQEAAAAEEPWPLPTVDLVFNFSTDEIGPSDGPTELWPGTHIDPSHLAGPVMTRGPPAEAAAEEAARRAAHGPPVANTLPRGAVSVRDFRLWHRGVPNTGSRPRHMLAISYSRRTSANKGVGLNGGGAGGLFQFGRSAAPAFDRAWWPSPARAALAAGGPRGTVSHGCEFVDDERIDHFGNLPLASPNRDGGGGDRGKYWRPAAAIAAQPDDAGVGSVAGWIAKAATRTSASRVAKL